MPEVPQGGPERIIGAAPEWIGAVFDQGNRIREVTNYPFSAEILVPHYDVRKEEERQKWIFENMRVFLDGTVASPEGKWKSIVDNWLSELRFAANRVRTGEKRPAEKEELPVAQKGPEKPKDFVDPKEFNREHILETERDLKAIMAVCSSARAMEVSAGVASTYLTYVTLSEGGRNLDVQDTWRDFLLHEDPNKLKRVVGGRYKDKDGKIGEIVGGIKDKDGKEGPRFPLIQKYYDRIIEEAGIEIDPNTRIDIVKIDKEKALKGNLVKFLKENKSLDEYIADFVGDEKDEFKEKWGGDTYRWACAKVAADAFLVNLYTQWEYDIDKKNDLRMKPVPTWGGNPFRAVLEPSFLPRRIKRMYSGEDSIVLDLVDRAFRPEDLVPKDFKSLVEKEKKEEKLIKEGRLTEKDELKKEERERLEIGRGMERRLLLPSATVHLKFYARYNNALWAFLGENSRAVGIPLWTKDTMGKELPTVVENLDQVYGVPDDKDKPPDLGKHVVGLAMMRLIHCKALAVTMESSKPGFRAALTTLFGDVKERPFLEVRQFLFGPLLDARSGFLQSLAGGRTRFVFGNNILGREEIVQEWRDTWNLLATNDQEPGSRKKQQVLNTLGFVIHSLAAISETQKRR